MNSSSTDSVSVSGVIDHFLFRGDQDFVIFRLRRDDGGREVVVGKAIGLTVQDHVRVTGGREDGPKGPQIKAHLITKIDDISDDGVARAIVAMAISGIGIATARDLVLGLGGGAQAIDKLSNLSEVSSTCVLSDTKAESLVSAWSAQKVRREVDAALASLDITPGLRNKIFEKYGKRSLEIINTNPYQLALEVSGIGFTTADALALSLGMSKDDPKRLNAAVYHSLYETAESDGHTYSSSSLLTKIVNDLDVSANAESIQCELKNLEDAELVTMGKSGGAALSHLYACESTISDVILKMLGQQPTCSSDEFDTMVVPDGLSEEQSMALGTIVRNKVVILTGGPGTGKSFTIKAICQLFVGLKVQLAAPTGRAARRMIEATGMPAKTIHNLLGYGRNGHFGPDETIHQLPVNVLILDEASMIDVELLSELVERLPLGCRFILVGDPDQLPPVGAGAPFRDLISSGLVPVAKLTKVHRQAEQSHIVQSAHAVRNGLPLVISPSGDRSPGGLYMFPTDSDQDASLTTIAAVATQVTSTFGIGVRDIQCISPMRKGMCGVNELNRQLQNAINPERSYETFGSVKMGDKIFRRDDRVMQTKNDSERNIVNGDIGYVTDVDRKDGLTVRMEDGREVIYSKSQLRDLDLAYATTIHKMQGSESKAIVLVLTRSHYAMLTRTILYTAITRARELCVIVGHESAVRRAIGNHVTQQRRTLIPMFMSGKLN